MTSEQIKNFFQENNISPKKIISDKDLDKFYYNAAQISNELEMFCSLMIDADSNGSFITKDTWDKLEEYWMCFETNGKIKLNN